MNFIKPMDFAVIINDKLAEHGLNVGDTIFVAGVKALPLTEEDPYTQRVKFFIHKMNGDDIDTSQFFMIDPTSVERVDEAENERLYEHAMKKATTLNSTEEEEVATTH